MKVAIIFHCYYDFLFSQFKPYIDNVINTCRNNNYHIGLIVSYQHHTPIIDVIKHTYQHQCSYHSIIVDRGCDTGPFLLALQHLYNIENDIKYDLIFKIQTKKLLIWRHQLLNSIAGTEQIVQNIINDFKTHPKLGMTGSSMWLRSPDTYNYPLIDNLAQQIGIQITNQSKFIGGTCFWARASIFYNWINQCTPNLINLYQQCELGYTKNDTPTYTHSWERLFGYIVCHYNYYIKGYNHQHLDVSLPNNFNYYYYLYFNYGITTKPVKDLLLCDNITNLTFNYEKKDKLKSSTEINISNFHSNNNFLQLLPNCTIPYSKCTHIICKDSSNSSFIPISISCKYDKHTRKWQFSPNDVYFKYKSSKNILRLYKRFNLQSVIPDIEHNYLNIGQYCARQYNLPIFDWHQFAKDKLIQNATSHITYDEILKFILKSMCPSSVNHNQGLQSISQQLQPYTLTSLGQQLLSKYNLLPLCHYNLDQVSQKHLFNQELRKQHGLFATQMGFKGFIYDFTDNCINLLKLIQLDEQPHIPFCLKINKLKLLENKQFINITKHHLYIKHPISYKPIVICDSSVNNKHFHIITPNNLIMIDLDKSPEKLAYNMQSSIHTHIINMPINMNTSDLHIIYLNTFPQPKMHSEFWEYHSLIKTLLN